MRRIGGTQIIAMSVTLGIILAGCGWGKDARGQLKIDTVDRKRVDSLVLSISSDEDSAKLELFYPKDRVLLCARTGDKDDCVIYENCYSSGESALFEDGLITQYSGESDWGPRKMHRGGEIGFREGIGYKLYPGSNGISLEDILQSELISKEDSLGGALVARAQVEQMINGKWEKLTRFLFPGTAYFLAPQDTIRLRIRMGSMSVRYFSDRVALSPEEVELQRKRQFLVLKPKDGYWPFLIDKQDFFRTFSSDTLAFDEWLEFSYYVKPHTWHYSFDIHVLGIDGTAGPRQVIEIYGPNMLINDKPACLSRWILLPRPGREEDEGGGDGYPGGPAVPEWAARKLIEELGQPFLSMNDTNRVLYEDLFDGTIKRRRHE